MLTLVETYTDYNDVERTEAVRFNLTKAEILEMELGTVGGFAETVQAIIDAKNQPELVALFKKLILKAYGVKSADGRHFEKSEELSRAFSHSPIYSNLFMRFATDAKAAADFVNGIIPADLSKQMNNNEKSLEALPGETAR